MKERAHSAEVAVGKNVCSISIFSAVGLQLIFAGALQGHVRAWTNLGAKKEKD